MMPMQLSLQGKTAVITGAGGVLCGAFAKALGACGAAVAVLDKNPERAESVAAAIRQNGGIAKSYAADVLDAAMVQQTHIAVLEDLGPCDILINGAGGNHPKGTTTKEYFYPEDLQAPEEVLTFFDLSPKDISFVLNLNFLGTLIPIQAFARDMLSQKGGSIINVSSMNAFCPLTKIPAYSAAKAAVSNFTQWLSVHFSKTGIRVNALAPGFFCTEQNHALLFRPDGSPTERAEKILAHTPMARFGKPEELLGTLAYLLDDAASSFVTGVVIPIDGGFSAYAGV